MSALSEALVAAQRRTIAMLEKAYVAGAFEDDKMHEHLDGIGCADVVDHDHLLYALDLHRTYGGSLPAAPANGESVAKKPEPASDAQLAYIAKLVKDANTTGPDLPLSKEQAHEVIDSLKAGSYDAAKWTVPF